MNKYDEEKSHRVGSQQYIDQQKRINGDCYRKQSQPVPSQPFVIQSDERRETLWIGEK